MNVKVIVYDGVKYDIDRQIVAEIEYNDCKGFEIKEMTDDEIFALGFCETDLNKEYAVITCLDGETATYKNSFCDIVKF